MGDASEMTVGELIALLKKYSSDSPVYVGIGYADALLRIGTVQEKAGNHFRQVIICTPGWKSERGLTR